MLIWAHIEQYNSMKLGLFRQKLIHTLRPRILIDNLRKELQTENKQSLTFKKVQDDVKHPVYIKGTLKNI